MQQLKSEQEKMKLILGIETSCDDTSVAVYDAAQHRVLSLVTYAQHHVHLPYGGIKPDIAARNHLIQITPLVIQALQEAAITSAQLTAISYTNRPGLVGSLLVGTAFAKTLAYALQLPAVAVHHIEGHILSTWLDKPLPVHPYLALIISGGHTQIFFVQQHTYILLGESVDDAVGEVLDKCSKYLGLPYPGGAHLEKIAQPGDRQRFQLPTRMLHNKSINMSFSGLKSAFFRLWDGMTPKTEITQAHMAYALQETVAAVLYKKIWLAARKTGVLHIGVSGGVIANQFLRHYFELKGKQDGLTFTYTHERYCTDNAAMIAFTGAVLLQRGLCDQDQTHFTVASQVALSQGSYD